MNEWDKSNYGGVETGDILLTASSFFTSAIIQIGTSSKWGHAGIAIWMDHGELTLNHGMLHILDIDNSRALDVITKEIVRACRVIPFDMIKKYYMRIAYRKLNTNKDNAFYERLKNFIDTVCDGEHKINMVKMFSPWIGVNISSYPNIHNRIPEQINCSEVVAHYLREVAFPGLKIDPTFRMPADYGSGRGFDHLFSTKEIMIQQQYAPLSEVIVPPLTIMAIIILILIFLIYFMGDTFGNECKRRNIRE